MAKKLLTGIFYSSIALAGMLAFFVFLYWGLRRDSNLASLVVNTANRPLYFWPYVILTAATGFAFGLNLALLAWRIRMFGFPRLRRGIAGQAPAGIGSLIAFAASACPVCGSTLLAAIGVTGGLAAFPFAGLELKLLAFALIVFSFMVLVRDLRRLHNACAGGLCPAPRDASFREHDSQALGTVMLLILIFAVGGWNMLKTDPIMAGVVTPHHIDAPAFSDPRIQGIVEQVLPEKGFRSKIALGDSVQKMIGYGAVDPEKFASLYAGRQGGMPDELRRLLERPSHDSMLLTAESAPYYLNLLWPLGLANRMTINDQSPLRGPHLFNFASTGGWVLGKEENGGAYFNKFAIVPLTPDQERLVKRIADNAYRPCCDNSTFFQDCNHGSALLGLLELGASQGLSEEELWREALAFNSFWFPETYVKTALYFKVLQGIEWNDVDPKVVMGKEYSSASGWYQNVERPLQQAGVTLQLRQSGGCGV